MTDTSEEYGERFWIELERLAASAKLHIDRPAGSAHPRFPQYVYPLDYGYLEGTQGGDGEGVDVWRGTGSLGVGGVVVTIDPFKRNTEIKILYGLKSGEIKEVEQFYRDQPQAALIVKRPHR